MAKRSPVVAAIAAAAKNAVGMAKQAPSMRGSATARIA
jgi:hypothetical protein